ncbi:MAG: hypothetical protein KGI83_07600, partial [Verrucomicrobiota bacterium]|nr:hypothetical protein [Verrucomicrobiota bacterium]
GGVFSIWDVIFDDAEMQDAFNDVIRRKDLLAGYESYLCDRYFFRKDQAERMFREAGFTEVKLIHQVHYLQSTLKRRDAELGGDPRKLQELNQYILQRISGSLRDRMQLKVLGDDIQFVVPNRIMTAIKKRAS